MGVNSSRSHYKPVSFLVIASPTLMPPITSGTQDCCISCIKCYGLGWVERLPQKVQLFVSNATGLVVPHSTVLNRLVTQHGVELLDVVSI